MKKKLIISILTMAVLFSMFIISVSAATADPFARDVFVNASGFSTHDIVEGYDINIGPGFSLGEAGAEITGLSLSVDPAGARLSWGISNYYTRNVGSPLVTATFYNIDFGADVISEVGIMISYFEGDTVSIGFGGGSVTHVIPEVFVPADILWLDVEDLNISGTGPLTVTIDTAVFWMKAMMFTTDGAAAADEPVRTLRDDGPVDPFDLPLWHSAAGWPTNAVHDAADADEILGYGSVLDSFWRAFNGLDVTTTPPSPEWAISHGDYMSISFNNFDFGSRRVGRIGMHIVHFETNTFEFTFGGQTMTFEHESEPIFGFNGYLWFDVSDMGITGAGPLFLNTGPHYFEMRAIIFEEPTGAESSPNVLLVIPGAEQPAAEDEPAVEDEPADDEQPAAQEAEVTANDISDPTPAPPDAADEPAPGTAADGDTGLSGGVIAAIVIGAAVIIAVVASVVIAKKKKTENETEKTENEGEQ